MNNAAILARAANAYDETLQMRALMYMQLRAKERAQMTDHDYDRLRKLYPYYKEARLYGLLPTG